MFEKLIRIILIKKTVSRKIFFSKFNQVEWKFKRLLLAISSVPQEEKQISMPTCFVLKVCSAPFPLLPQKLFKNISFLARMKFFEIFYALIFPLCNVMQKFFAKKKIEKMVKLENEKSSELGVN